MQCIEPQPRVVVEIETPFFVVGGLSRPKAVYVYKLFYTWTSPLQPNGDVVKSFLFCPFVLFNRFWWLVLWHKKCQHPHLTCPLRSSVCTTSGAALIYIPSVYILMISKPGQVLHTPSTALRAWLQSIYCACSLVQGKCCEEEQHSVVETPLPSTYMI